MYGRLRDPILEKRTALVELTRFMNSRGVHLVYESFYKTTSKKIAILVL